MPTIDIVSTVTFHEVHLGQFMGSTRIYHCQVSYNFWKVNFLHQMLEHSQILKYLIFTNIDHVK